MKVISKKNLERLAEDFTFNFLTSRKDKNFLRKLSVDLGEDYLSCLYTERWLPDKSVVNGNILLTNAKPAILRYMQKCLKGYFEKKGESFNVIVEGNGHIKDPRDYVVDIGDFIS